MKLTFEPGTGRLRLDLTAFEALVAHYRDPACTPRETRLALQAAGALTRAGLHPTLVPGLEAVDEPLCRLLLTLVEDEGPERVIEGWVSPSAALLRLPVRGDGYELVTVLPAFLPAAIARIVGLGPRRLVQAERVLWRAETSWTGPDGEKTGRAVAVADTSGGCYLVEPDGDDPVLRPASPTAVWRLLPLLLPADHEVGR